MISFLIPDLRLVNQSNVREHWSERAKRATAERLIVSAKARGALTARIVAPPYHVTVVRIGPGKMDRSNLYVAAKHVEDALSEVLGVDDGDEANWLLVCKQERPPKGAKYKYAVRVEIRDRAELAA